MLYEQNHFTVRYPALVLRYPDCNTVDYVLYVQHENDNMSIILPDYVQRVCIIIGASVSVKIHHDIRACVYMCIHLEQNAQLCLTQSLVYSDNKRQLDVRCFGQASSSFIFRGWYTQTVTAGIAVYLQGEYAQAQLTIGTHMQQAQVAAFTTMQHHQVPHTASSLQLKGLVQDGASCAHTGTIHVDTQAQHANATLHSNFLLLTDSAQAYTQPILQVLNSQVRCAHGSAIGSCDDQQLFYIGSRGVSQDAAKQLLSDAFLGDIKILMHHHGESLISKLCSD